MLFVKAPAEVAESIRKKMLAAEIFDPNHAVEKSKSHVYFPAAKRAPGFDFVERKARTRKRKPRSLREALEGKLAPADLDVLVTSFDTIGDIAVIEVRYGLDEALIGNAILESHPAIKTVCKKGGAHTGPFRVMPVKVIAGENKTSAVYQEHGVRMRVDVDRVYFSPRLSSERLRIAKQVVPGEEIAGFFAGVGPFPLVIAKKKKCRIYAVELNPHAFELMRENIAMNKLRGEILPTLGDVREIAPYIPKCDRVLMPSPKTGESFLEPCISAAKPGGVVHYYEFAPDEDPYSGAIKRIEAAAESLGRKAKILNRRVVRPHSVRVSQVAIDFSVN
ncbi:MAG: class I SAM-dependent methyltransferase family protein [Candidatus Diapherotrites archaeon]|nr:class I SAM-dependent methyltransferase family protein [Candidatus Diapherotrites archaeon]